MGFPERFSELLETRGITAYKLSKETGFSQALISQWKNGKQVPSADRLMIIADYLGVSMDYLMCRTDRPASTSKKSKQQKERRSCAYPSPLRTKRLKSLEKCWKRWERRNKHEQENIQHH